MCTCSLTYVRWLNQRDGPQRLSVPLDEAVPEAHRLQVVVGAGSMLKVKSCRRRRRATSPALRRCSRCGSRPRPTRALTASAAHRVIIEEGKCGKWGRAFMALLRTLAEPERKDLHGHDLVACLKLKFDAEVVYDTAGEAGEITRTEKNLLPQLVTMLNEQA